MNSQQILKYIEEKIDENFILSIVEDSKLNGVTASEIEEHFNMFRSNASTILNQLTKEGLLVKINSRPVYFLPSSSLSMLISKESLKQVYTPSEFIEACSNSEQDNNAFEALIGYEDSLATQVEKAKAAILYPPNGLHTLITGESGTGKTVFARAMYNFGLQALHKNPDEFPFVEFNCSDYYHNPQLLMSHLFGHVKGAFTGADTNQEGLVAKANGGVLFLDEIHRLPPEGQEMLFYLLDTGSYRRLGETKSMHKANIRIIGATTENPEHILLKTFQRRIPLTIEMPAYRDKGLNERIKINEFIFNREAVATLKQYILPEKIMKALASYPFPENIGQLSSEIKVLCARSLLSGPQSEESLNVSYDLLSKPIRDYYETNKKEINIAFPLRYESKAIHFPLNESLPLDDSSLYYGKTYLNLVNDIEDLRAQGYSKQQVQSALSGEIHEYCNNIVSDFYGKTLHTEEMYKVINKEIVDFTMNIASIHFNELSIELTQKNILILAFHFKYLIERKRQKKDLSEIDIDYLKEEHTEEVSVSREIVAKLTKEFNIEVDNTEKYLIALILANMKENSTYKNIALVVIAHGKSTATSIANVCNELMGCDIVTGIDVPLNQNLNDTYANVLTLIKRIEPTRGALLLVDMGSLIQLGDRLAEETGYNIRTLPNLTTLKVLNYTRLVLNGTDNTTIDEIIEDSIDSETPDSIEQVSKNPEKDVNKSNAILSVCASGAGTSSAFKTIMEKELASYNINDVEILALSAFDIQRNSPKYQAICAHYSILAYIGNFNMNIEIPFFHITDLISQTGKKSFIDFITQAITENDKISSSTLSVQEECITFLGENIMCLNPIVSVEYSDKFIASLNLPAIEKDRNLHFSLLLHLGFMLERNVLQKKITFDDMEPFIEENKQLYDKIKSNIYILNEPFDIDINDAEICFIIKSLSAII